MKGMVENMNKNFKIKDIKIALIYGNSNVDGINKDGTLELISKAVDDTAHYFYMKEFLETNFVDEPSIQNIVFKNDVNSIFFELQKLGHIAFAENTSIDTFPSGLLYIPKLITTSQKETLKQFQKQLEKENYNITALFNLFRAEDEIIMGNQLLGNSDILDEFTKDLEMSNNREKDFER